jgi:hypothetical protein
MVDCCLDLMGQRPDQEEPSEDDPPSTGYFVLFLCVLLVVAGLVVTGVIPSLFD